MTRKEAIDIINVAQAEVEWEYPLDYLLAFRTAVDALSQPEIIRCKDCKHYGDYINCPMIVKPKDDFFCGKGERNDVSGSQSICCG